MKKFVLSGFVVIFLAGNAFANPGAISQQGCVWNGVKENGQQVIGRSKLSTLSLVLRDLPAGSFEVLCADAQDNRRSSWLVKKGKSDAIIEGRMLIRNVASCGG